MNTLTKILLAAAQVIESRGLYRGGFMPPGADPGSCPVGVLGAINVAAGYQPDGRKPHACEVPGDAYWAAYSLYDHLDPDAPDPDDLDGDGDEVLEGIGGWADEHTARQIITTLRASAAAVGRSRLRTKAGAIVTAWTNTDTDTGTVTALWHCQGCGGTGDRPGGWGGPGHHASTCHTTAALRT